MLRGKDGGICITTCMYTQAVVVPIVSGDAVSIPNWLKIDPSWGLCTKSRSFIGFLGVKIGLSGLEKAFKMRLKRSQ